MVLYLLLAFKYVPYLLLAFLDTGFQPNELSCNLRGQTNSIDFLDNFQATFALTLLAFSGTGLQPNRPSSDLSGQAKIITFQITLKQHFLPDKFSGQPNRPEVSPRSYRAWLDNASCMRLAWHEHQSSVPITRILHAMGHVTVGAAYQSRPCPTDLPEASSVPNSSISLPPHGTRA